jgi:hypothetical protein
VPWLKTVLDTLHPRTSRSPLPLLRDGCERLEGGLQVVGDFLGEDVWSGRASESSGLFSFSQNMCSVTLSRLSRSS